jgi:hypothetical protein
MAVRKETIKKQFNEALPAVLEPGEQVQAGAYCVSGPNPLWSQGLLGLIGMLIFGVRYYFMAVTDRRVIVMKASFWTSRPTGVAFADPRAAVSISEVNTEQTLWAHLKYLRPGADPLRLNFHTWWRDEMRQIVSALGEGAPGPEGQPPPPPPPA